MATDVGIVILSGALPLLGVLIGTGSTIFVQRISVRESRLRAEKDEASTEPQLSLIRDQVISERNPSSTGSQPGDAGIES